MRTLLLWFFEDVRTAADPSMRELRHLRRGLTRARHRDEYHTEQAREASARMVSLAEIVRTMEVSAEVDVSDLVEARKELLSAEADLKHHRLRGRENAECVRLMKLDGERLRDGDDAEHRDRYRELLDH